MAERYAWNVDVPFEEDGRKRNSDSGDDDTLKLLVYNYTYKINKARICYILFLQYDQ